MGGKYQKPFARELGYMAQATGSCASGNIVDQECNGGFSNVGPCTTGITAGQGCSAGTNPAAFGPCTFGTGATNCGTGTFAGKI